MRKMTRTRCSRVEFGNKLDRFRLHNLCSVQLERSCCSLELDCLSDDPCAGDEERKEGDGCGVWVAE